MAEIVVTGSAERRVPADRAVVNMTAPAQGPDRAVVVAQAADTHGSLVGLAQEWVAGGAAESYTADPIATFSNTWRDEHGQPVTEHHATVTVTLRLTDLERVGSLTLDLAERGIDPQVAWELSPDRRSAELAALRAEAVADATRAATDYAAAIGSPALEISELRDQGGASALPVARALATTPRSPDVTLRDVEVRVAVEITFRTS